MSRNQAKIDLKIEELQARHPSRNFIGVQADLSSMDKVELYRDLLKKDELANLDIGMICLNAGCVVESPVDLTTDADFERVVGLNMLHPVYFTKAILPDLLSRESRSCILFTGSLIANRVFPGVASYAATKSMVNNFAQALHFEVKNKVDVTVWEPGPCETNIRPGETTPTLFTHTA